MSSDIDKTCMCAEVLEVVNMGQSNEKTQPGRLDSRFCSGRRDQKNRSFHLYYSTHYKYQPMGG